MFAELDQGIGQVFIKTNGADLVSEQAQRKEWANHVHQQQHQP